MHERALHIGIIGCGYWGQNFVRIINHHPDCKLIAIADIDEPRLRQMHEKYPQVKVTTSIDDILLSPEVDAVIVATPVTTHYEVVKRALLNGKHVLCEKVLSDKIDEIKSMQQLAAGNNLVLLVGLTFLFNSVVRYIKSTISDDELGRIQYLTFKRTGHGLLRNDVDVVNDLASHDISILLYWMGMPEWVSCNTRAIINKKRADIAFLQIGYANGIIASVHVSWISPLKQRIIEITGTKSMMIFDDVETSEKLRIIKSEGEYQSLDTDFGGFQLAVKSGDIIIPNVEYPEPLIVELEEFISLIKEKKPVPEEINLSEKIWRVIECAYISNRELGRQIPLNNSILP